MSDIQLFNALGAGVKGFDTFAVLVTEAAKDFGA